MHWIIDWGDGYVQTCASASVSKYEVIKHVYKEGPYSEKYFNVSISYDTSSDVPMYYGWTSCIGAYRVRFCYLTHILQVPYMSQGLSATDTGDNYMCRFASSCTTLLFARDDDLPDTVTRIGDSFREHQYLACTALIVPAVEVIPNSVTTVGDSFRAYQYQNCTALTTPAVEVYPNSIEITGAWFRENEYSGCNALTTRELVVESGSFGEYKRHCECDRLATKFIQVWQY
jgi:hypothetical protein